MRPSTGIQALDELLHGLRLGDNLVWKVNTERDYAAFVEPFWRRALQRGESVVYFRFAHHEPIVERIDGVTWIELHPEEGFEPLLTTVHRAIANAGPATNYVFDLFSDLVRDWFSERMIGNFFLLTCPYIRVTEAIAFFGVLRDLHSYYAVDPIDKTAQIVIDVHRYRDELFVHLLKADQRHAPELFLLHRWDGDALSLVTDSTTSAAILRESVWPGLQSASYRMIGMWDRRFMVAEECALAVTRGERSVEERNAHFDRLASQLLTGEPQMLALVRKYLELPDLIDTWKHVIGSGMIGGKAVGMLLSRAILKKTSKVWKERLERHDSFFVAADLFYTFLVTNDCWWIREKQKNSETLLDGIGEARARILRGTFPDYVMARFSDMLDYFGQSPIVVRSSSLLEDTFLNSFPGKYESVFCPNQGTRQQRLEQFLHAVRLVYASSFSEDALLYRAKRGLLDRDEQMALLVQRVSGNKYGQYFYPHLAGVGMSLNPFVWSSELDARAGLARLVFGLGTRAVDRNDDDYTRIVSLDEPFKRPESSKEDIQEHTQRRIDYLDLTRNQFASDYFSNVVDKSPGLNAALFAERPFVQSRDGSQVLGSYQLEFDGLLRDTPLVEDLRSMLTVLRQAYGCEVEIEFTINFKDRNSYTIHLLQCRPLRVRGRDGGIGASLSLPGEVVLMHAYGAVLGSSRVVPIDRICYVSLSEYGKLPTRERYAVARLVGRIVRASTAERIEHLLLIGPGRFGTTVPELGVPVTSGELNGVSVLCEVNRMHEGLNPELSFGTHFFHEIVESDLLYVGCAVTSEPTRFEQEYFEVAPNRLLELFPNEQALERVVRIIDPSLERRLTMRADNVAQEAVLCML
jgi:hypothetical protein